MQSSINWEALAIVGIVITGLGVGARLAPDGWIKTSLSWAFIVVLVYFCAILLLTALFIVKREG